MELQPNWKMGELHFDGVTAGSLNIGNYQYSYRMKTEDGYQTPWHPITTPVLVTGKSPKSGANSETYGVGNVGEKGATGNRITINGIDTRYTTLEVAYVYSQAATGVSSAGIFATKEINFSNTSISINHTTIQNTIPLSTAELTDLKDVISRAKTLQIKDNRLWFGNIKTKPTFSIPDDVLQNAWVEPEFRGLRVDDNTMKIKPAGEDNTGDFRTVLATPQTNRPNKIRRYRKYGASDLYAIKQKNSVQGGGRLDYINYQGVQMCHSFTGYFRGETYRFALVFFDKKGFPFFAKHFADVTMPEHAKVGNALKWSRVREDGSIVSDSVPVGRYGALLTETNINYDDEPVLGFTNGNRILAGKSDSTNVSSHYKIYNNAPKSDTTYRPTPLTWSDPNVQRTTSEVNTSTNYGGYLTYTRILGLRFGGIDLNVNVEDNDGNQVKLYELVGGVMIVRAPREGADEQVKDTGIIKNCQECQDKDLEGWSGGTDSEGRKRAYVNPTPIQTNPTQHPAYFGQVDYGGGNVKQAQLTPNLYSFDGINHKMTNEHPVIKQGITKIKMQYLVDSSKLHYALVDSLKWLPVNGGNNQSRHYVSKNPITYNASVLGSNYPLGAHPAGKKFNINKVIDANVLRSSTGFGYIADRYVSTEVWLSNRDQSKDWLWNNLGVWKKYDGSGGTWSGTVINDTKSLRGAAARTLLMDLSVPYITGVTDVYKSSAGDFSVHSMYVVSIFEENSEPYGGLKNEAIQNTEFYTTGQFLSIDDAVLADIDDSGNYELNEIEVWGGDCYADLFSFLRIYPVMDHEDDSCTITNAGTQAAEEDGAQKEFRDFSHGVIFPVESKYNFRLTYKNDSDGVPTWSHVGTATGAGLLVSEDDHKSYANPNTSNGLYISTKTSTCGDKREVFQLQAALNYTEQLRSYVSKPVGFVEVTEFPSRWAWSSSKGAYGQATDYLREFDEISNFDLNGTYGAIIGNGLLGDQIYSLQESAIGRLRAGDRAMTVDPALGNLKLGDAGVMEGIDYISKIYGSQHRDSIKATDRFLYWVDARMRKIMKFSAQGLEPISDTNGIHSFLDYYLVGLSGVDSITGGVGITTGHDHHNGDIYFTIKDGTNNNINDYLVSGNATPYVKPPALGIQEDSGSSSGFDLENYVSGAPKSGALTISFNEHLDVFHSIHSFYPSVYIQNGKFLYYNTNNGTGDFYVHNMGERGSYYGNMYYSVLQLNVNEYPTYVKKFDNMIWNINEESLKNIGKVVMESEGVTHEYENLSAEIVNVAGYRDDFQRVHRAKYRQGLLKFPIREPKSKKPRLSGKSMKLQLWIRNTYENLKANITTIQTNIRLHNRK